MIETATLSVIEVSPDISIAKTERFDVSFARQLIDDVNIPDEDKLILKRMVKARVRGNELDVSYKLGKNCKEYIGRFYALRGVGLQTLSKDLRSAVAGDYYWDADMVNCQFSILVQACKTRGLVCSKAEEYCNTREERISEICDNLQMERREAKEKIISILFGASADGLPTFCRELEKELRSIAKHIANEVAYKHLRKKGNYEASALALFLQTEERKCLMVMSNKCKELDRSLDTLIHDGGLIRKLPNEKEPPKSLLREIEKAILEKTGYALSLVFKPMLTSFVKKERDTDYQDKKVEFEKQYFKLMTPPIYVREKHGSITYLSKYDLIHQQSNLLLEDGSKFIDRWVADEDIRTYERLVFSPKKDTKPDEFNLFKSFGNEAKEGDFVPFITLLKLICNNEEIVVEYMLNWLAHIIQKPYFKTGVCVVISGTQGVGKDTFFNYFADILGKEHFYNTSNPENNVFARFNTGTERAVLVKFEEANFTTNRNNADKLKSIITSPTETYDSKGLKSVVMEDYRNFVMTTNHDVPIVIEDTDRRFVLIRASSEKQGDTEFWNTIHSKLSNPVVQSAFHYFLLNRDISKFKPQQDRPRTKFYNEVKETFVPVYARFLQEQVLKYYERYEIVADAPYPEYSNSKMCDIINEKSKYDISETKLGRELNVLVEAGCILKHRTMGRYNYTLLPEKITEWLKNANYWVEY